MRCPNLFLEWSHLLVEGTVLNFLTSRLCNIRIQRRNVRASLWYRGIGTGLLLLIGGCIDPGSHCTDSWRSPNIICHLLIVRDLLPFLTNFLTVFGLFRKSRLSFFLGEIDVTNDRISFSSRVIDTFESSSGLKAS